MNVHKYQKLIENATKQSAVAQQVLSIMIANMTKYPGIFLLINSAMTTGKRNEIENALVAITSRPMTDADVDRCMDILREAGCV